VISSFRAYIDESGDEGFKFRTDLSQIGTSDWFVLSAFVTRSTFDLETVKVIDEVRTEFGLHLKKHVHFKDLKHAQKVRYAQMILGKRGRIISVCVHKPSLLEPEKFRKGHRLYFYAVRYLLERLTWLVRDYDNQVKYGGDGTVKILFSNRGGMSYPNLKAYLELLRTQKDSGQDIRIEFDRYSIGDIETQTPGKSMGLQLADAAAGATFNALERDCFGNSESRYISILLPIHYRTEGKIMGYGIKVVPRETITNLPEESNLEWLWKLNKNRQVSGRRIPRYTRCRPVDDLRVLTHSLHIPAY
jgi:hypothetical protein